jgi:alpha-galactosidase
LHRFGFYPGPADNHVAEFLHWGWEYCPTDLADWLDQKDEQKRRFTDNVARLASARGPLRQEELVALRGEGGQRWQTIDTIRSLIDGGNRYILSLNIPNDGYISNMRQRANVEIPAIVGADHIYGLRMGALPEAIAAMMELQLRIMDLAVEAAVSGSRQTALEALMIDPVVPNPRTAQAVLDEMLMVQADLLPQFR